MRLAPPAAPIPAVGYIRVSKAREEMISPTLQRQSISEWATRSGRVIVAWLEDLDRSGREFAKRKIGAGIKLVEDGTAVEVVVYRYDRWGRNAADSLANIRRTELAGGKVVSTTEPFDAETAIGKYTRTNALALAEMQSDIIGEGWRQALAHRVSTGVPHGGGERFGYSYNPRRGGGDGQYAVDPRTGPVLAELYTRAVSGHSAYALAQWMNTLGLPPPRSPRWTDRSLRDLLDSGFGAGLIVTGRFRPTGAARPTPRFVAGAHEAVITAELWEAYRSRRAEASARPIRAKVVRYRLTGLLVCGHCGGGCKHTSSRAGVTGRTIMCSAHAGYRGCVPLAWTRLAIEAEVREWLAQQLTGTDAEFARAQAAAAKRKIQVRDTAALVREREDISRRLVKLLDGWSRGVADDESYQALRASLLERQRELDAAIVACTAAPEPVAELFQTALAGWDHLDPPQANAVLRNLVGAVIIRRGQARILGRWETR